MRRSGVARIALLVSVMLVAASSGAAKTLTYNEAATVSMRDRGLPADERCTNVLLADGNLVYGATSGDRCHVFRFDPITSELTVLASIPGPNTVMKGMAIVGDAIYVGTMLTPEQLWLKVREEDRAFELEDANLIPIEPSYGTGHLYRIAGIHSESPRFEDLGVPVAEQGIHTLAADAARGVLYGVTAPMGRFFVYDTRTGRTEHTSFGRTYTNVSDHRVAVAEVEKELADLTPGEGEWNNRLIPRAMHVRSDGTLYTSGWRGQILKYDPAVEDIRERFRAVAYIPSVPGRQHWNRIDAIVEHKGNLYMGTSDGYIIRLDPDDETIANLGKPMRAIEVMGIAVSPLDGNLYGVNGGGLEGMSRLWSCDPAMGAFEVDIPALPVVPNRHCVGALVCTQDGTMVIAEATRLANLWVMRPGEAKEWEKTGVLKEFDPQEGHPEPDTRDRFAGHKKLEVEVFPIPSRLHGGSGYTAIQADRDGKVYVGTAYYGSSGQLVQLDPETARWRSLFRADELIHRYGRGQSTQGKIHTKLRLGADGKIYGAMKQGYELHYRIRSDVGEAPAGYRGGQCSCHFFAYDPVNDETVDMGPGPLQEGITSFDVDTERGYVYGATVPGVFFLVYDLGTNRAWNAGQLGTGHPYRYMPCDHGTGRVYHPSEATPEGRSFMTVWDPDEFRLRDYEIVADEGFTYRHSYATCTGAPGTAKLYGSASGKLFEMDLDVTRDGKLHVRPLCDLGVENEPVAGSMYAIERGPDNRIYWASLGGNKVPLAVFAWDPATEAKTYLGSCALGGEWIDEGHCQGLCLDADGNLALHVLYAHITKEQQEHWRITEDFEYDELRTRPYYRGFPAHREGTFYSVYCVRNATSIR